MARHPTTNGFDPGCWIAHSGGFEARKHGERIAA
jgi:hypothetical protein